MPIDASTRYEKKFVEVLGRRMAYVEHGTGDPIVFLHGNATSSYMWRNIMPRLEGRGRLIAIDNIGQGDSDKLPDSGPHSYWIAEHQQYIDAALAALDVRQRVTLVMHDWGGPMGFDWARRNEAAVLGLAHCEAVVIDHPSYDDYGPVGDLLKRLRGPDGEQLVLQENFFVERVFTAGVMRDLDDVTMAEMRRPYSRTRRNAPRDTIVGAPDSDRRRACGGRSADRDQSSMAFGEPGAKAFHQCRARADHLRYRS